jgi:hypothetical protein
MTMITYQSHGQVLVGDSKIEDPSDGSQIVQSGVFDSIGVDWKKIFETRELDFNGDGINDYIFFVSPDNEYSKSYKEIWMTRDYQVLKFIDRPFNDHEYLWIVNIDEDSEPEILLATEDGGKTKYCFINQDLKNGNDSIQFYFSPIILKNKTECIGNPWSISELITLNRKGKIDLRCFIDQKVAETINNGLPIWQKILPIICFQGQCGDKGIRHKFKWLTFQEIIQGIK